MSSKFFTNVPVTEREILEELLNIAGESKFSDVLLPWIQRKINSNEAKSARRRIMREEANVKLEIAILEGFRNALSAGIVELTVDEIIRLPECFKYVDSFSKYEEKFLTTQKALPMLRNMVRKGLITINRYGQKKVTFSLKREV